jgi:hypothetical protein
VRTIPVKTAHFARRSAGGTILTNFFAGSARAAIAYDRRMGKGLTLLFVALLALTASSTSARAGAGDLAATQAYLRANYALVHAGRTDVAVGEAAVKRLLGKVRGECPRAAAGSPEDPSAEQLSNEVVGAMTIAALRPAGGAIRAFVRAVAPLRWSNPQLTRQAAAYARKLKALVALEPPDLCADVRAWSAGGFHALPATTTQFDLLFTRVDVTLGEVPTRLFEPYERSSERAIIARTKRLEDQLTEAEARAVALWGKALEALALNP